jgi:hypothetical protein
VLRMINKRVSKTEEVKKQAPKISVHGNRPRPIQATRVCSCTCLSQMSKAPVSSMIAWKQ